MAGKLSNTEKFAIKGMIAEGKSSKEIADELGRSEAAVIKYVGGELESIIDTMVKVRMEQAEQTPEVTEETPPIKEPVKVSKETMVATIHKLRIAGFNKENAKEIIDRILRKVDFVPDNAQQLYALCVRYLNTKDVMINRAAGGREGVAVMTQAASERIDEFHKTHAAPGTRKVRQCVFKPKEGKMLDDE